MKIEKIKDYLLNNIEEVGAIVSEINSIDGSLEYLDYWENDEEFFNTFFSSNPMEVARTIYYGDYRYCDDYVKFDGYGNLETIDQYGLENKYREYIDEIVDSLLEHYQKMCISDELIKLIEEE